MAGQLIILHLDMDGFYAFVEQRDDPTLDGTIREIKHTHKESL